MPNTSIIGHQSLNSSKTEKSEKWHWPRLFQKRRTNVTDSVKSGHQAGTSSRELQLMDEIVKDDAICLLCLQVPGNWFKIETCGCKFCHQCMEMYTICSIKNGDVPITCPDGHCPFVKNGNPGQLSRTEVRHLVSNELFPLYLRLELTSEVAVDPKKVWCPRPGCETVCTLKENPHQKSSKKKFCGIFPITRKQRKYSVVCPTCQFSFCSQCRTPWHSNAPCPSLGQFLSSDTNKTGHDFVLDDPIAPLEREGRIKRCPFCQVPIERDDGCAQMMCKHCRHVFCWFCLASLDDDFMLRHYDSGPCRSRLGHSRVSVVWHRTQVVSAFLGLGVLFLVTSPLLLLASPCFLCWRHHSQSKNTFSRNNVDGVTFSPNLSQDDL